MTETTATKAKNPYIIRAGESEYYSPANHTGTKNYRLIGPLVNGAKFLEINLGDIERHEGSPAHAHPDLEQAVYILEGEAISRQDRRHDVFPAVHLPRYPRHHPAYQAPRHLFAALWRRSGQADQVEAGISAGGMRLHRALRKRSS
jgi:hypothetical protein